MFCQENIRIQKMKQIHLLRLMVVVVVGIKINIVYATLCFYHMDLESRDNI